MYCKKIPRLFSVLTPLREDSMALTFPGIPLQPSDRNGFIHLFPYSQLPNPIPYSSSTLSPHFSLARNVRKNVSFLRLRN